MTRGCGFPGSLEHLAKEALSGTSVAPGGEQEVDRLSIFIHGSVEVFELAFDPDEGFINAVALEGGFQMAAAALLQLWAVGLDPPPDATSIDGQASLPHPFSHVPISERVAEVVAD